MRLMRVAPVALGLALVVGACGDSTGPQIQLSTAELNQLLDEISSALDSADVPTFQVAAVGAEGTVAPRLPAVPPLLFGAASMPPVSFTLTVGCELGGSVTVSGNGNETETTFDFTVTETFSACQTPNFTIGGSVTVTGNGTSTQTSSNFTVDVDGNLSVTTASGLSGSCRLDYGVTFSATSTTLNFEVHGTICGRNVQDIINEQNTL